MLQNGKRSMTSCENMFHLYHSGAAAVVHVVGEGGADGGRGVDVGASGQEEA